MATFIADVSIPRPGAIPNIKKTHTIRNAESVDAAAARVRAQYTSEVVITRMVNITGSDLCIHPSWASGGLASTTGTKA